MAFTVEDELKHLNQIPSTPRASGSSAASDAIAHGPPNHPPSQWAARVMDTSSTEPARPDKPSSAKRARVWLQGIAFALAVGYPVVVYFGLSRGGTRFAAWLLLALALGHSLLRSAQLRKVALRSALPVPLCLAALWLDDRRYMLALPVLINAGLFSLFFGSLWGALPLVERFARMRVSDLSEAERKYCRSVTKLWSGFFVLNGGTAAILAVRSSLDLWTLYTGLISYILIGLVGASEYTVRKYRFGRFGDGFADRLLRALLPTRSTPP